MAGSTARPAQQAYGRRRIGWIHERGTSRVRGIQPSPAARRFATAVEPATCCSVRLRSSAPLCNAVRSEISVTSTDKPAYAKP